MVGQVIDVIAASQVFGTRTWMMSGMVIVARTQEQLDDAGAVSRYAPTALELVRALGLVWV